METLVVALALLAIVVLPVNGEGDPLLVVLATLVMQWMLVFSAFWQHFLLHPWAG